MEPKKGAGPLGAGEHPDHHTCHWAFSMASYYEAAAPLTFLGNYICEIKNGMCYLYFFLHMYSLNVKYSTSILRQMYPCTEILCTIQYAQHILQSHPDLAPMGIY